MGLMIATGVATFIAGCVSAAVFLFMLMLALNGFMGQQRAVNAAFTTYVLVAAGAVILTTFTSVLAARFMRMRFGWHTVLVVILCSATFSFAAAATHFGGVIAAAVVAEQMRTTR
jgi:hypothetical protein